MTIDSTEDTRLLIKTSHGIECILSDDSALQNAKETNGCQKEHYFVIECPPDLLTQQINGQEEWIIRGESTDKAVLCTADNTYSLRSVQTTNNSLFIQRENDRAAILIHGSTFYLEVSPSQPTMERIRTLLEETVYKGTFDETRRVRDQGWSSLYNTQHFLEHIPASEAHILAELHRLEAVQLNGYWRLVDRKYLLSVLETVLLTAVELDMELSHVLLSKLTNAILSENDIPAEIIRHCVSVHSSKTNSEHDTSYSLDRNKVSRLYGEMLLANWEPDDPIELNEFLNQWRDALPESIVPELSHISGLYLMETQGFHTVLKYLPKELLPSDPRKRLEDLFLIRAKWTREDLLPYVSDLAPTEKQLDALLLKFARVSKVKSQVFYTTRFALGT